MKELNSGPILGDWEPLFDAHKTKAGYFHNLLEFHAQKPHSETEGGRKTDDIMAWAWITFFQNHLGRYIRALKEKPAETFLRPPFIEFTTFPQSAIPPEIIESTVQKMSKEKINYLFEKNPILQSQMADYICTLTQDKKICNAPSNRVRIKRFVSRMNSDEARSFMRDFRSWLNIKNGVIVFDSALLTLSGFKTISTQAGPCLVKGLDPQLRAHGLSSEVTISSPEGNTKYALSENGTAYSYIYAMTPEASRYNPVPKNALIPLLHWEVRQDGERKFSVDQPEISEAERAELPIPKEYSEAQHWDTIAGILMAGFCVPEILESWGPYVYLHDKKNPRGPVQMPVEILRRQEEIQESPLLLALERHANQTSS
jgi:hypothetical protein